MYDKSLHAALCVSNKLTWQHSAPAPLGSLDTAAGAQSCTPAWTERLQLHKRNRNSANHGKQNEEKRDVYDWLLLGEYDSNEWQEKSPNILE